MGSDGITAHACCEVTPRFSTQSFDWGVLPYAVDEIPAAALWTMPEDLLARSLPLAQLKPPSPIPETIMSEVLTRARDLDQEAMAFARDPVSYFGESHTAMQDIARDELEALQLRALQLRFESLRSEIPMLTKLAERQGIFEISAVEDVVPLLFEHTMFKSYPPVLLEKNRFKDLTTWLSKLTTVDLSEVDSSGCESIDDWIALLDRETPLKVCHSSGTSGTMSFLPTTAAYWDRVARSVMATYLQPYGQPRPERQDFAVVFPFFRDGASSHLRSNDYFAKYIAAGDPDRVLAAYPGRMSSDVLFLSGRVRAAQARGDLDRLVISPTMLARKAEFETLQSEMPTHMDHFFEEVEQRFRGKPVFVAGTWNLLHAIATKGLAKGEEAVFAPQSVVSSGGGAKGMTPPDGWEADVCRFFGVDRLSMGYGMSEIAGMHLMCEQGHYHFVPWVVPILLNPETSKPLPRAGVTTGRAAFFDLSADTHWGGFISGDEITVHWDDRCLCGRKSARIVGGIQRYSDKNGGDDKITCAATESAHQEAMSFLNGFE